MYEKIDGKKVNSSLGIQTFEGELFHLLCNYHSLIVPGYYLKIASGEGKEAYKMLTEYEEKIAEVSKNIAPEKVEEIDRSVRTALDPQYDEYLKRMEQRDKDDRA